jgi:hypothetical protein
MNQKMQQKKDNKKKKEKEIRLKQEFINTTPEGEKKGNVFHNFSNLFSFKF